MAPKSVQELLETANSGNYFSFTVVRHPFDRLVSAYRDRILHGCTDQAKYHIPQIFSLTRRRLILLGRENQVMEFLTFIKLVKTNFTKLFSKGQLISKADWRAIDSPKKRTDEFD
mgnify:CR=1 FL=1